MKLGFVGIGSMGAGMARNLLRAGHTVTVYNRSRAKAEALEADGASVANTPAEAAKDAEAVLSMLADDAAVSDVVFGSDGIAAGLKKGGTHVSCSTIGVDFAKRLEAEHKKLGQHSVTAVVFGRPQAAENKQLIVVAAGQTAAVDPLKPALEAMGRRLFVAGEEPWQANAIKLCGNFMIASLLESYGEAFATVRKAGIAPQLFLDVISELFGSPLYKNYGQSIVDGKFEPAGFVLKLGLKDVRLVLEAAGGLNVPMPIASLVRDHLLSAMANGQEQMDWSSITEVSARNAGLQ